MVPELIKLAESGDPHQIQGACEALGLINTPDALPVIVKQLAHPDRCVRYKAAEAVGKMGGTAKPAVEDILKALVATAEPSWPIRWEDPVQVAHGQLAAAVFSGPLREELNKVDPKWSSSDDCGITLGDARNTKSSRVADHALHHRALASEQFLLRVRSPRFHQRTGAGRDGQRSCKRLEGPRPAAQEFRRFGW
jgi:hypothetical protein